MEKKVKNAFDPASTLLQSVSEISKEQSNEILSRMFGLIDSMKMEEKNEVAQTNKKKRAANGEQSGVRDMLVLRQIPVKEDSDFDEVVATVTDRSCGFIKKNQTPSSKDIGFTSTSTRYEERVVINDLRFQSEENKEKLMSLIRSDVEGNQDIVGDSCDESEPNCVSFYTPRQEEKRGSVKKFGSISKNGSAGILAPRSGETFEKKNPNGTGTLVPVHQSGDFQRCDSAFVSAEKYDYDKRSTMLRNPSGLIFIGESPEPSKIHSILLRPGERLKEDSHFEPSVMSKEEYEATYEYKTPERSPILRKSHFDSGSHSEAQIGSVTSRTEREGLGIINNIENKGSACKLTCASMESNDFNREDVRNPLEKFKDRKKRRNNGQTPSGCESQEGMPERKSVVSNTGLPPRPKMLNGPDQCINSATNHTNREGGKLENFKELGLSIDNNASHIRGGSEDLSIANKSTNCLSACSANSLNKSKNLPKSQVLESLMKAGEKSIQLEESRNIEKRSLRENLKDSFSADLSFNGKLKEEHCAQEMVKNNFEEDLKSRAKIEESFTIAECRYSGKPGKSLEDSMKRIMEAFDRQKDIIRETRASRTNFNSLLEEKRVKLGRLTNFDSLKELINNEKSLHQTLDLDDENHVPGGFSEPGMKTFGKSENPPCVIGCEEIFRNADYKSADSSTLACLEQLSFFSKNKAMIHSCVSENLNKEENPRDADKSTADRIAEGFDPLQNNVKEGKQLSVDQVKRDKECSAFSNAPTRIPNSTLEASGNSQNQNANNSVDIFLKELSSGNIQNNSKIFFNEGANIDESCLNEVSEMRDGFNENEGREKRRAERREKDEVQQKSHYVSGTSESNDEFLAVEVIGMHGMQRKAEKSMSHQYESEREQISNEIENIIEEKHKIMLTKQPDGSVLKDRTSLILNMHNSNSLSSQGSRNTHQSSSNEILFSVCSEARALHENKGLQESQNFGDRASFKPGSSRRSFSGRGEIISKENQKPCLYPSDRGLKSISGPGEPKSNRTDGLGSMARNYSSECPTFGQNSGADGYFSSMGRNLCDTQIDSAEFPHEREIMAKKVRALNSELESDLKETMDINQLENLTIKQIKEKIQKIKGTGGYKPEKGGYNKDEDKFLASLENNLQNILQKLAHSSMQEFAEQLENNSDMKNSRAKDIAEKIATEMSLYENFAMPLQSEELNSKDMYILEKIRSTYSSDEKRCHSSLDQASNQPGRPKFSSRHEGSNFFSTNDEEKWAERGKYGSESSAGSCGSRAPEIKKHYRISDKAKEPKIKEIRIEENDEDAEDSFSNPFQQGLRRGSHYENSPRVLLAQAEASSNSQGIATLWNKVGKEKEKQCRQFLNDYENFLRTNSSMEACEFSEEADAKQGVTMMRCEDENLREMSARLYELTKFTRDETEQEYPADRALKYDSNQEQSQKSLTDMNSSEREGRIQKLFDFLKRKEATFSFKAGEENAQGRQEAQFDEGDSAKEADMLVRRRFEPNHRYEINRNLYNNDYKNEEIGEAETPRQNYESTDFNETRNVEYEQRILINYLLNEIKLIKEGQQNLGPASAQPGARNLLGANSGGSGASNCSTTKKYYHKRALSQSKYSHDSRGSVQNQRFNESLLQKQINMVGKYLSRDEPETSSFIGMKCDDDLDMHEHIINDITKKVNKKLANQNKGRPQRLSFDRNNQGGSYGRPQSGTKTVLNVSICGPGNPRSNTPQRNGEYSFVTLGENFSGKNAAAQRAGSGAGKENGRNPLTSNPFTKKPCLPAQFSNYEMKKSSVYAIHGIEEEVLQRRASIKSGKRASFSCNEGTFYPELGKVKY